MSSPPKSNDQTRLESIKQYYQQLCNNYRIVTMQLQQPDLPTNKRQVLIVQLERLQAALQEFNERVIKPIVGSNTSPTKSIRPVVPIVSRPPINKGITTAVRTDFNQPGRSSVIDQTRFGAILNRSEATEFLDRTKPTAGVLLDTSTRIGNRGNKSDALSNRTVQSFLNSKFPHVKVDCEAEALILQEVDRVLARICEGVCEFARHRKRPGISTKDLELVMRGDLEMIEAIADVPFAVPPSGGLSKNISRKSSSNPHLTKLSQLKKYLASTNL